MSSGGGWRPPVDNGSGGGYMSAAFSTDNLEARMGEAPSASNIAFHPVLNLGVVNRQGVEMQYFNPKSLVAQNTLNIAKGADVRPLLTAFAAKGTKVVLWNGDGTRNTAVGLNFFPLELTAADRAALQKAYGKLPAPVALRTSPAAGEAPMTTASTGNPTPSRKSPTPTKTPTRTTPTPRKTAALPRGVIAMAGFNDGKGLNANTTPNTPYPLGRNNVRGGAGELGWRGEWEANPNAMFVKNEAAEGDGAVHLVGTTNFGRSWSVPQKGVFMIEASIRCPAEGGFGCYVWESRKENSGPNWGIGDGQFRALNGDHRGSGSWVPIAPFKPDTWHKVKLTIDVEQQTWRMGVDDAQSDQEFGFRYSANALQALNFLVEGKQQIHIDAIRILSESEDE